MAGTQDSNQRPGGYALQSWVVGQKGVAVEDEQLSHVLPVLWEHIDLLERHEFDVTDPSTQTDFSALSLRSMDAIVEQLGLGI